MLSVGKCCGSKPPVIGGFLGRQRASQVLTGRRSWLVMRLLLSGVRIRQRRTVSVVGTMHHEAQAER